MRSRRPLQSQHILTPLVGGLEIAHDAPRGRPGDAVEAADVVDQDVRELPAGGHDQLCDHVERTGDHGHESNVRSVRQRACHTRSLVRLADHLHEAGASVIAGPVTVGPRFVAGQSGQHERVFLERRQWLQCER